MFVWEVGGRLALRLTDPDFQRRAVESTGVAVRVFVAGYDWRQDDAHSAQRLARVIDGALGRTGASQVVLVAHSMGGLVGRWYCRYGGADKVAALILLGSPTHGAPQAYRALKVGLERWIGDFFAWAVFPLSWPGGRLRMLRRFPSSYQLLPTATYCAHEPGWLGFDPTVAGIRDASDPALLYRNPVTGFLEGPDPTVEAHLAARERFDRGLGTYMPDPTFTLYRNDLPTEARYTLVARGSTGHGLEFNANGWGDGTVIGASGRADWCALGRGARLGLGPTAHRAIPDDPIAFSAIQTIVLRTRRSTGGTAGSLEGEDALRAA